MTFDWHMLYPLHTVILDNSQVFGGVPCKAQLCNFSKWFFSPRFGVVPIWELWQFCYVRMEPPKSESPLVYTHVNSGSFPCAPLCGDPLYHMLETPTFPSTVLSTLRESVKKKQLLNVAWAVWASPSPSQLRQGGGGYTSRDQNTRLEF